MLVKEKKGKKKTYEAQYVSRHILSPCPCCLERYQTSRVETCQNASESRRDGGGNGTLMEVTVVVVAVCRLHCC